MKTGFSVNTSKAETGPSPQERGRTGGSGRLLAYRTPTFLCIFQKKQKAISRPCRDTERNLGQEASYAADNTLLSRKKRMLSDDEPHQEEE